METSGHLHTLLALPRYIREDDGHQRLCGSNNEETRSLLTSAEDKTYFSLFDPLINYIIRDNGQNLQSI
jgi:hypothetical protein